MRKHRRPSFSCGGWEPSRAVRVFTFNLSLFKLSTFICFRDSCWRIKKRENRILIKIVIALRFRGRPFRNESVSFFRTPPPSFFRNGAVWRFLSYEYREYQCTGETVNAAASQRSSDILCYINRGKWSTRGVIREERKKKSKKSLGSIGEILTSHD